MAKCKCSSRPKIVSSVVQSMNQSGSTCVDVCANPVYGEPNMLGIFAPLIYDEIGINLCTTFDLSVDISTLYPTATNATISVLGAAYTYGDGNVQIEAITGRQNCYSVILSNITLQFAVNLYDCCCRLLGTVCATALYLPSSTAAPTYDEDTNPTAVELEIFAPYGLTYDLTGVTPYPVLNSIGFETANNTISQGINLYSIAKLLNFNPDENTITVGVTMVLQSLYYAGYKVRSAGKIDVPKGSIITPDNTDCMRFVAGDLLNLVIKPLDLGAPANEQCCKNDCGSSSCGCSNTVADKQVAMTDKPVTQ